MRTLSELLQQKGRVYVYLKDDTLAKRFLSEAEQEGFTFGDGVKPTRRQVSDLFALNRDRTINYVGFVGHMAFQNADHIGEEPLIRIDYAKYLKE